MRSTSSRRRRAGRILGAIALGAASLVVLVAIVLAWPGSRHALLRKALDFARASLPGELTIERAAWPGLLRWELEGLLWTLDSTPLLRADGISLDISSSAAWRRDLLVRELRARVLYADLAAIQRAFADTTQVADTGDEPASIPYLRSGAFRGLPSMAIERLEVSADSLALAPAQWALDLELVADVDLLATHRPTAHVDAQGHDAHGRWRVQTLTLALDAQARQGEGHARVELADVGVVDLVLTAREESGVQGTLALEALGEPLLQFSAWGVQEEDALVGLDLEGALIVPALADLARIPALSQALRQAPALEAARGTLALSLRTHPQKSARARVELGPNAWLSSLQAGVTARAGSLGIEQFDLRMPQLALQVTGAVGTSLDVAAQLEVTGSDWIGPLAPQAQLPDPLELHLTARLHGTPPDLQVDATAQARAFDHGFALATAAAVDSQRVQAKVSRVAVRHRAGASPLAVPSRVNLTFDRQTQAVAVQGLQIDGDYGPASVSGTWQPDRLGRVTLDALWPQLPQVLAAALADSVRDAVAARWPTGETPRLRVEAELTPRQRAWQWEAVARLDAPGPATFVPLLPGNVRVDDLTWIHAQLDARGTTDSVTTRLTCTVDLSATAWIDSAVVRVEGTPQALDVSAGLKLLESVTLSTEGHLTGKNLDLRARIDVSGDSLLARLAPPVEGVTLALGGDVTLEGTTAAPELRGRLEGSLSSPTVQAPAFVADAAYGADGVSLELTFPSGLVVPQAQLDRVVVGAQAVRGETAWGPVDYHVMAQGPELELEHAGTLTSGDVTRLESDTLHLVLLGQDLALRRPLRLSVGPHPTILRFEQVDLHGSLGSIEAAGSLGREAADVHATATLVLPEKPAELALPVHLWPRAIDLELKANGPRSLVGSLSVRGVALDGEHAVELTAQAQVDTMLVVKLVVDDATQRFAEGDARLAFDWDRLAAGEDPLAGPMRVELATQSLPLPATWLGENENRIARLDATMSAQGTLQAPAASARAQLSFPEWPRIGAWVLRIEADLASQPQAEITARWHLVREGQDLLSGDAHVPVTLRPAGLDPDRPVRLATETATLSLRDVDELLPADIGMDGSLSVDFSAEGRPDDPRLQGNFVLEEASTKLADGSSLTANGRVDLSGTARLPSLRGSLSIQEGVMVIPDAPPSLLPAEGTSLLWDAAAAQDTAGVKAPAGDTKTPLAMEIDLKVDIPSGLWIRGKGLELEVAGQLRLARALTDTLPTITGELAAVRGSFTFLGHDFILERGAASFFGSALTPELDAQLGTNVSATRVWVIVSGNAVRPQLRLESNPEMTEGDITSLLLFGRPLDELDDDQLGLVRNRTNEVAKSFGMAAVQGQVRQRLGVDLLQIDTGTGEQAGSVLVGKYLRPNVLLKYEQMLQETTAFLVNLEYLLTREVRVETSYGRRLQSSVELNWTKDY